MLYAFCQWPSQMCASVGRSLDNDDNNNTIGLFSAFHGPQRHFREQTCKVVVVENHVTHRLSSSFHSTLAKTPSSPIAPAEKNVWRRHWQSDREKTVFEAHFPQTRPNLLLIG